MSQTLQQESLIVALSKCAIKIGVEKIFGNFNCFCLEICFVQIRSVHGSVVIAKIVFVVQML